MTGKNACPTDYRLPTTHFRKGFTLIELLMVFAVIVVLLAASAPMLRMFAGTRSIEGAQNQVAAALEAARSQAIATHEIRGVLFVYDTQSRRIKGIIVRASEPRQNDAYYSQMCGVEVVLDGAGMDPVLLPSGVMLQTIDNWRIDPITNLPDDRYIGFNRFKTPTKGDITIPIGGAILFDADGRLATMRYSFRISTDLVSRTELGDILFPGLPVDTALDQGFPGSVTGEDFRPPPQLPMAPYSSAGLVLCDRDDFDSIGTLSDPQFSTSSNVAAGEKIPQAAEEYVNAKTPLRPGGNEEWWLDEHSVPILINRVSGAVIKGE